MKKQFKFFSALFAAAAMMASCSNDDPVNPGTPGEDDAAYGDSYLSVSLMMPTSIGGRADESADDYNGNDNYDKGSDNESKVDNIVFFFFDSNNNCVDIQKVSGEDAKFTKPATPDENPYVSSYGIKEVRLKAGVKYDQVAIALNSSKSVNDLRSVKSLSDLESRADSYVNNIVLNGEKMGQNQIMSNSVFFNTENADANPAGAPKYILVPITKDNIYTSEQRPEIDDLIIKGDKKYVEIYVERVASKIVVGTPDFNFEDPKAENGYYVTTDANGEKVCKITVYDNVNLTTKEITITPVVKGMSLNVLTNSAKLIKPLDATQVGYGIGGDGYMNFRWNDPKNMRSYWASTDEFSTDEMTYFTWEEAKERGSGKISQYIHPNTQDFEPIEDNESNSLNTKVMVVAQLQTTMTVKDEDGNESPKTVNLDLVRYGSEYMLSEDLFKHVANTVNHEILGIEWRPSDRYTPAEKDVLAIIVNNTVAKTPLNYNHFTLDMLNPGNMTGAYEGRIYTSYYDKKEALDHPEKLFVLDYETVVNGKYEDYFKYTQKELDEIKDDEERAEKLGQIKEDYKEIFAVTETVDGKPYYGNLAALLEKANQTITKTVINILSTAEGCLNNPRILYWKDGMTYFYTPIHHQGFYGLVGNGTNNYLNGVVRNHIYNITLAQIYGLGTPVIDPKQPIDPERPSADRPSYLKAKINILPWRIVTNNATLH